MIARQTQKELLKGKVMKDHDAASFLRRLEDARMIAMVVAQVVDDRIEIFQPAQIRIVAGDSRELRNARSARGSGDESRPRKA